MADFNKSHAEVIAEFRDITGHSVERARQILEDAHWNFDAALASCEGQFLDETETPSAPPLTTSSSSRIVTMSTLRQNEDKSDEEEGQAFYAGGSTRSGQQVLGPGKKNNSHIVKEMFRAAKSHGAEVVEPSGNRYSTAHLQAFGGTGYVLGATSAESSVVVNPDVPREQERREVCLRAWRTGFTIDDGPFREYSNPENEEFINSIRRGQIPPELFRSSRSEVGLNIEDRSQEDYVPPKPSLQIFSGQGHRLGSPVPKIASATSVTESKDEAEKILNVDSSLPVTTIQIRLSDGTRLVVKLNHHHTIRDVRQYIVVAHPEYSATEFTLMTSFPPTELTNDDLSIKDANLLNSILIQKLM